MKGLLLVFSGIKNNFKQLFPVMCAMVLTIAYSFSIMAFMFKIMMTDPNSSGLWSGLGVCVALVMALCMGFVYGAYFKASNIRIQTARILGATRKDIVICVIVESVLIFAVGIAVGALADTIINSSVYLLGMNEHVYLDGKTFGYSCGFSAIVPFVATAVTLGKQMSVNRVFRINRD